MGTVLCHKIRKSTLLNGIAMGVIFNPQHAMTQSMKYRYGKMMALFGEGLI
jgi:hypothetical protein